MLIDIDEVRARVPVARRTIYALMDRAGFPRPVKVPGRGNRAFWEPEAVDQWRVANRWGRQA